MLTPTVGQAARLRSLGIAAAPAGRLQDMNFRQLKALAALLRNTQKKFKDVKGVELTLVLANWLPGGSAGEPQLPVHELAQFLTRAVLTLSIEIGDVAVWNPTRAEQEECEFAMRFGDPATLWATVFSSIESSSYAIEGFDTAQIEQQRHPADWRQALQRVRVLIDQEVRDGETSPELNEMIKVYSELVDQNLVDPVIDLGEQSRDPLQKILLTHAAEATRTLQLQKPAIHRLLLSLATGGDNNGNADLIKQLAQRHQNVRDLLQLVKIIRK